MNVQDKVGPRSLSLLRRLSGVLVKPYGKGAQRAGAAAFAQLYDRHSAGAFAVAQSVCQDISLAEEVVQEGGIARPIHDDLIERDERETLRNLVGRLPGSQAEVIALAFFGELTHAEIATRLDLPEGTVKGRVRLGMEKLRRQMDVAA